MKNEGEKRVPINRIAPKPETPQNPDRNTQLRPEVELPQENRVVAATDVLMQPYYN